MRQFLLLFILCLIFISPAFSQTIEFEWNRTFGIPFYGPSDITLDEDKNMYVLDYGRICKYDYEGNLLKKTRLKNADSSNYYPAFHRDLEGNFYVINYTLGKIQKFNPSGDVLHQFGQIGSGPGQFNNPLGLALDAQKNIYVADTENGRIQKFTATGTFLFEYKLPPTEYHVLPAYNNPVSIQIDSKGIIHILTIGYRLFKVDATGQLLDIYDLLNNGYSPLQFKNTIALDQEDNIYFSDAIRRSVHKLDSKGRLLFSIGSFEDSTFNNEGRIALTVTKTGELFTMQLPGIYNQQTVKSYSPLGKPIKQWGNSLMIKDLTEDQQGNYYVLNYTPNAGTNIQKFNPLGHRLFTISYSSEYGETIPSTDIEVDAKGNLYCLNSTNNNSRIVKFNGEGKFITTYTNFASNPNFNNFSDLDIDVHGNMYLVDYTNSIIQKLDPAGKPIASFSGLVDRPHTIGVDKLGHMYVIDYGNRIQKLNPSGEVLAQLSPKTTYNTGSVNTTIEFDDKLNVYVNEGDINVYDASGRFIQKLEGLSPLPNMWPQRFSIDKAGSRLLISRGSYVDEYLSENSPRQAFIIGKLFDDDNRDCALGSQEKALPQVLVVAEPGPFYGISDKQGNYIIPVDTGSYRVRSILKDEPGQTAIPICPQPSTKPVIVDTYGSKIQGPNLGHSVINRPMLTVYVSSDRRRRCFRNTTTVTYSNVGYGGAQGSKVMVQLPPEVILISASFPFTKDNKGNHVFEVGDLAPNTEGKITITDSVSCADPALRGLTVCTKAWITPSNTYPSPVMVGLADVAVEALLTSATDTRVVLTNNGPGNMPDSLSFRILQDATLSFTGRYKLAAGDSLVLQVPADKRVIRVEADQPKGHLFKTFASANLEVPSLNDGIPSPIMSALPPDDPEPEVSEQCLPIIDSYDPNDKQVIPAGLTSEHYTPTNTPLRYTVRFQNTGTDVAYRVVVVDTLSADLDISTLKVGAVSHPYRLSVTGKIRPVLMFTFDNIMLPDSATDLAGSNGQLQFSIKPKANLPEKHLIENLADIFFDYNEPVRTNTTVNRVYDMPVVMSDNQLVAKNVIASPRIMSFWPGAGKHGSEVTITGTKFIREAASNQVYVNGAPAQILEASDTFLRIKIPVDAYTGRIKVVTPDGATLSQEDITVYQPPVVTGLSSTEGIVGAEVTIIGEHLRPDLLESITLGTFPCQIARYPNNGVIISIPQGATSGVFTVYSKGGTAKSNAYRVWQMPSLTGFDKTRQRVGGNVTLQGIHFAPEVGRNQVLFGDKVAKVVSAQEQQVTVQVPAGAVSGMVKITTPGGNSSKPFEVIPAPVITEVLPTSASVGSVVELKGIHFLTLGQQDTISFGNVKAEVLNASSTVLKVRVPKGAMSGSVSVAGIGGSAKADFAVLPLTPQESIEVFPSPNQGTFTIDFLKADFDVQSVQMLDKTGRTFHSQMVKDHQVTKLEIDLPQAPAGLYVLLIKTAQGTVTKRVVIQ
ncbi:hypothetical protein TH61_12635 [Rufibacter sp. DG15C]|uniref:DUF7619 domain-containing protein n=1 Tax=Rufibacter sp. DG15C TaxID=1379909 RepID=UPI00078C52D1|nr:IPT/TIG domain-containing protein [Rufibacter sp. DG15C]AMM51855.1 hypothetical protein TH61_12635 [Rufibacter sp. DG15C]